MQNFFEGSFLPCDRSTSLKSLCQLQAPAIKFNNNIGSLRMAISQYTSLYFVF